MKKSQKRNKSKSKSKSEDTRKSQSKSRRNFNPSSIIDEADFQRVLLDIDLTKPRNAYTFFIKEKTEEEKAKGKSIKISEISTQYAPKWNNMGENDRKKYEELSEDDRKRYQEHLSLVRKFIIAPPLRETSTGYSIFCDTMVSNGIEKGEDFRDAREEARKTWANMSDSEREIWLDKADENKDLYEDMKNFKPGRVNSYTLFLRDKRLNGKSFKDAANEWKKANEATKNKYEDYAAETNREKEMKKHMWEMINGIKPKLPRGAYKFFVIDFSKDDEGGKDFFKRAGEKWKKLKDSDKEKYVIMAKREKLIYEIKSASYKNFIKSIKPSKRGNSALNIFMSENKHLAEDKDLPQGGFFAFMHEKWQKLSDNEKKKYETKAEESRKEAEYLTQKMETCEYTLPKRPGNSYTFYIKKRVPILREKHKDKEVTEIFKLVSNEWNNMKSSEKKPYEDEADSKFEIYKQQVNQFKTLGYYTEGGDPDFSRKPVDRSKVKSLSKKKAMHSEDYYDRMDEIVNESTSSSNRKRGRSKDKRRSQSKSQDNKSQRKSKGKK